ncbi:2-O-methyltransferase NoeI [Roseivivax sp. THAF40]|uniref:FkbM family methyltransferase n=1 Tax=unclassified Roseivivax TaxID=2639302 RepID=UPI001268D86D|nr:MULTISPECIES: FkbM family methyltransferase [unclassified Roseivivax]QFS82803.1 2-O-methyltransferase NoeI [Roseivivax sp. THAF197b]QFT46572.1 2-O-methyltransferase NoeI [Roseivivax sp. THAF40]
MNAAAHAKRIETLRGLLAPERLTEIIDVGANPTELPLYMPLVDAKAARVTGFEPQPAAFEALGPRQSAYERYLPYAVGDGQPGTLHICRKDGFTSLLEPEPITRTYLWRPWWSRMTKVLDKIPVETRRLDDMEEIEALDLLKIDIQGGELSVFQNGREKLANALVVVTEVAFMPLYKDQPLLDQQMTELLSQGFLLHSFRGMVDSALFDARYMHVPRGHHKYGQLIDSDAIFLRDPRRMTAFGDDQLKHYALLADGALDMPDLAARCLTELVRREAIPAAALDAYRQMLSESEGAPT